MKTLFALILSLSVGSSVYAQKVEISNDPTVTEVKTVPVSDPQVPPQTGKDAAGKYFKKEAVSNSSKDGDHGDLDHYLTLGLSFYVDSTSYRWGPDKYEDPAEWAFAATYRMGEWVNSTDFLFRLEYQRFDFDGNYEEPQKLSFVPLIIFPDARSGFPVYFGLGAGLGVFVKQIDEESSLSVDYTVFVGGRIFDIFEGTGFFIETGLKNHFHLLSSGQLNAYYFTLGTVHTF